MKIVKQIDGAWTPLTGEQVLDRVGEFYNDCTILYRDGRQEVRECEPYPKQDRISMLVVEGLLANGTWGDDDLATYGLKVATPFETPEGKRTVGEPRYVQNKGIVSEVFDVEDVPPPAPAPEPPTPEEKLAAAAGLTSAELDQVLAAAIARQADK